jgi:hypothetical protein
MRAPLSTLYTRNHLGFTPVLPLALIHRSAWKVNPWNFAITESYEVRSKGIGGLLLDHRLGWLSGRYGVCVPMYYPPLTVFGPKDHRRAQGVWGDVFTPAYLGL